MSIWVKSWNQFFNTNNLLQTNFPHVVHTSSMLLPKQYSCIFRIIPHLRHGPGAKTLFNDFDWNHVSNEPIFLIICTQYSGSYRVVLHQDKGPRVKLFFYVYDWNYMSNEQDLFKCRIQLKCRWQWSSFFVLNHLNFGLKCVIRNF